MPFNQMRQLIFSALQINNYFIAAQAENCVKFNFLQLSCQEVCYFSAKKALLEKGYNTEQQHR